MKRSLYLIAAILMLAACGKEPDWKREDTATVHFTYGECATKSLDVDDSHISNCNILVYDTSGHLVASAYSASGAVPSLILTCGGGAVCKFYCICNIGDITGIGLFCNESALWNYQYTVSDYDDIIDGNGAVPMTGSTPAMAVTDGMDIHIDLTRCVTLLSISLDDTALVESTIVITSIKLRNAPRKVGLFDSSAATSASDCTATGDYATSQELSALNNGGSVHFYMFENDQGVLLPANTACQTKWFEDGSIYEDICSYVELEGTYDNQISATPRHGTFTYRFYLGENVTTDFSVLRNHHYYIVVKLNDDGVDEVSWRVDSNLAPYGSSLYPIRIKPTMLALDGWMLGAGSGTENFGVTVYYNDGSSILLTEDGATTLIVNSNEWNVSGEMLYAPDRTGELSLSLEYTENGHTVYYESCGSVVKPADFYTASARMQVAKKYGDVSDTPAVISNLVCYSDHEVELSDWLSFTSGSSLIEPAAGGFRLKGAATSNGDIAYSITGSLTDSFGNPFSKTMNFTSTIFEWRQRYYNVMINTNVRTHIDASFGSQEQPDNIKVSVYFFNSHTGSQLINRYYYPASYDENGDLIYGYYSYTWYDTEIRLQMLDIREYLFNHDRDGYPLAEGFCYDENRYIYYQPLN